MNTWTAKANQQHEHGTGGDLTQAAPQANAATNQSLTFASNIANDSNSSTSITTKTKNNNDDDDDDDDARLTNGEHQGTSTTTTSIPIELFSLATCFVYSFLSFFVPDQGLKHNSTDASFERKTNQIQAALFLISFLFLFVTEHFEQQQPMSPHRRSQII